MAQNEAMAWSTREIAELAGTSLRAVRHYHDIGLLAEPERRTNGYKQYGVAHLIRLVRIKRLVDLGFSLPQIAAMGDTDGHPEAELRALDAELADTIGRLQEARAELSLILQHTAPTDLPTQFASPDAMARMSDADRSLVVVMTRVLGPRGLQIYADLINNSPDEPVVLEFDELPADADEATRQDLAERMVPYIQAVRAANPDLGQSRVDAPGGQQYVEKTITDAMHELYNEAQLDTLRRQREILKAREREAASAPDDS